MGSADITRDQFSAAKAVIRKIAQRNVYIVDSDFNEQAQVSDYRLTELAYLLAQGKNIRFGSGWAISGGSNQISISAGKALIQLATGQSYILNQTSSPLNVAGWTTPTAGNRIDILYADISLPIIDVGDDATIVNPTVGLETCVDQRLTYTLVKLQGTVGGGVPTIPTPPAGHYYVAICQIARTNGQATINIIDIVNSLVPWSPYQFRQIYGQSLNAPAGRNLTEFTDWSDTNTFGVPNDSGANWYKKIKVALWKDQSFNTVIFRAETKTTFAVNHGIRVTVGSFTPVSALISPNTTSYQPIEIKVRVDSAADGDDLNVLIEMGTNTTGSVDMRKVQILVGLE